MSIARAAFLTEIQTELEEYGEWETADGGTLDTNLLYAMRDAWEKRDWSFKFSTGELVTTDGNQGPYDPPAGFDSLVTPEVVSKYFDYDRFSVPPSIPDDTNGYKWDVLWNRLTGRLYLRTAPPAGTFVFYFRRALTDTSDLSVWPDAFRRYLRFRTMFYCLSTSEDLAAQADRMEVRSKQAMTSILTDIRRGESKQDDREPRDVRGYPLSQSYANEGDGFLGGG